MKNLNHKQAGMNIGLGLAVGIIVAIALNNIVLGVALGLVFALAIHPQNDDEDAAGDVT